MAASPRVKSLSRTTRRRSGLKRIESSTLQSTHKGTDGWSACDNERRRDDDTGENDPYCPVFSVPKDGNDAP